MLCSFFIEDSVFTHDTSSTKKFSVSSDVSTENETLKHEMTDIISIPEDSSSNITESSNEINSHDKSDFSIVQHIVLNRTNNENKSFDYSSITSSKDNTEKESKFHRYQLLVEFKINKVSDFFIVIVFLITYYFFFRSLAMTDVAAHHVGLTNTIIVKNFFSYV